MRAMLKRVLRVFIGGTVSAALCLAQTTSAAVITNGSFETGTFSGWTASDLATPFSPLSVQTAGSANTFGWPWSSSPTDGRFTAFSGFDGAGPGTISLAQDIGVVTAATSSLSFDYRAAWDLSTYCVGCSSRLFDVVVLPGGGGAPLGSFNIITAGPGTIVSDTGALTGTLDLSAFIGTSIRLSFDLTIPNDFSGPAQWEMDNVTLSSNGAEVPEPASIAIFGLGLLGLGWSRRKKA